MVSDAELFSMAVSEWGADTQCMVATEEIGEILSALSQFRRGRIKPMALAEEIADVRIMLCQIAHIRSEVEFLRDALTMSLDGPGPEVVCELIFPDQVTI